MTERSAFTTAELIERIRYHQSRVEALEARDDHAEASVHYTQRNWFIIGLSERGFDVPNLYATKPDVMSAALAKVFASFEGMGVAA